MTEIRSVSSTGGEKGVKPERYSLIPKAPLDLLSKVYGFGESKYAAHNYRKGYEWSKSYDALQRHLAAWWEREENDPESGLSHLGHAAFHVFALIIFSSNERYKKFDDRYNSDGSIPNSPEAPLLVDDSPEPKILCMYVFADGEYLCMKHGMLASKHHPREGAFRPCMFVDPGE